jgi:hypothetical protein
MPQPTMAQPSMDPVLLRAGGFGAVAMYQKGAERKRTMRERAAFGSRIVSKNAMAVSVNHL